MDVASQLIIVAPVRSAGSATTGTTLDPANTSPGLTLSGGNLKATANTSNASGQISRTVSSKSSGKYYAEFTLGPVATNGAGAGVLNGTQALTSHFMGETGSNSIGCFSNGGNIFFNNSTVATLGALAQNDVISIALDIDNGAIWFAKNGGLWNASGVANPATNTGGINIAAIVAPIFFGAEADTTSNFVTANFGATAFAFTAPSGFGHMT